MKNLRLAAIALPLSLVVAPVLADSHVSLESEEAQVSYAFGVLFGEQNRAQMGDVPFDAAALVAGMQAGFGQTEPQMTMEEAQEVFRIFMTAFQAKQNEAKMAEVAAFMEENAARPEVTVTESGLQYEVIAEGEGDSPTPADQVVVHYTGRLLDGTVFDSSVERGQPATFGVTQVIPGWTEALQLMKPGAKFEVWIPSGLAYGPRGAGGAIGPNETLNFEMELIEVVGG